MPFTDRRRRPLFFMVSGYLLFGRNEVTPAYVCRKVYSIIRYIVAICLIYWAIVTISHNGTTFWPGCIEEVFRTMVLRGPFTPFWFLWSMTIIYASLPVLYLLYRHHTKAFAACTGGLGLICIALFMAQLFGCYLEAEIIQPLKMWKWMFFFALGGVLRAYPAPRMHWGRIAICAAVLNAAQRYFLEPVIHDTSNLAFAGSPISLLFYIAVFCWATQRKWEELRPAHCRRPIYASIHDTLYHHSATHFVTRPRFRLIYHISAADMCAFGGRIAHHPAPAG